MPTYQEFPEHCGDRHIPFGHRGDLFPLADRCADACDDQLPLFSQVGRGLQGNGYKVEKFIDEENQTVLRGLIIDPHTGNETEDWRTGNINGGKLTYSVNYNQNTNPKTFTITFSLARPDDPDRSWTFTTPAIPYITDEPGNSVATVYTSSDGVNWEDALVYPPGKSGSDYNMPAHGEPWTVNLSYGKNKAIDCPTTTESASDILTAKQQAVAEAIAVVENPKLWVLQQAVKLVVLNIKDTSLTGDTRLIESHLQNGSIPAALRGDAINATLEVSYFDVLPIVTVDVDIAAGASTHLDVGNLLIVCANDNTYTPLNLNTLTLSHRPATSNTLKPPLLNPENLSNTGNMVTWSGSDVVNNSWALYTGVGDPHTRDGETYTRNGGSPWSRGGNPYFYIMNRATGVGSLAVTVDDARIYSCSYNMATLG